MKVYAASSWRNKYYDGAVEVLRSSGLEVYNFRNPEESGPPVDRGQAGFSWADIDPDWEGWTAEEYRDILLTSAVTRVGYRADRMAMEWADACVLVQPCGRSAHLELGWFVGARLPTAIYYPDGVSTEPELMYLMASSVVIGRHELVALAERWLEPVPF